jgi:ketosteroid isomerase-like protein
VAENPSLLHRYLRAGAARPAMRWRRFTPLTVQEELPNRLTPKGTQRDLPLILAAAERRKDALSAQRNEALGEVASADRVAVEVHWTDTVAVPIGTLPVGGQLRARFAMFLEMSDGRTLRSKD